MSISLLRLEGSCTNLPDRHVLFLPDAANIVRYLSNREPLIVCYWLAESVGEIDTIHEFTVDIELDMECSTVADPNWFATSVTFHVLQFDLWYVGFTPDADRYEFSSGSCTLRTASTYVNIMGNAPRLALASLMRENM
jgi:hypothetical protein